MGSRSRESRISGLDYSGRMRRTLAALAMLTLACDIAPKAAKPDLPATASWIRGQRVVIDTPQGDSGLLAIRNQAAPLGVFEKFLVDDLASAGAQVALHGQVQPGDLLLRLRDINELELNGEVVAGAQGEVLKIVINSTPDCASVFMDTDKRVPLNMGCLARVVVKQVLDSPRVEAAVKEMHGAPRSVDAPRTAEAAQLAGKLAVLEIRPLAREITAENARYFTDLVRTAALESARGVEVMTRENLLVLLRATGKDLNECEGECEVDTGRRIGADLIISGDLQKLGSRFKLSLRLHETRDGRLLTSSIASGQTIEQLDDASGPAVARLFQPAK